MKNYYKLRYAYRAMWIIAIGLAIGTVALNAIGFECPGHPADIGVEHEIDHHHRNERNRESYDRVQEYHERSRDGADARERDRPSREDYHRSDDWFRDNVS